MANILLEICVDSVASAIAAQEGGAQRLELCSSLLEGGLTPSAAFTEFACKQLNIGIMVMIRPRGGDFFYSDEEFAVMQRDIQIAKEAGAEGVVFGLLTADGTIDIERSKTLIEIARPMLVTVHRAFDMTANPHQALEDLIALGVERVLTSGQEPSPVDGIPLLANLVQQANGRIIIMPGGGVTENNIAQIASETGISEIHMSARAPKKGEMRYHSTRLNFGGNTQPPEYSQPETSVEKVRASLQALQNLP